MYSVVQLQCNYSIESVSNYLNYPLIRIDVEIGNRVGGGEDKGEVGRGIDSVGGRVSGG